VNILLAIIRICVNIQAIGLKKLTRIYVFLTNMNKNNKENHKNMAKIAKKKVKNDAENGSISRTTASRKKAETYVDHLLELHKLQAVLLAELKKAIEM